MEQTSPRAADWLLTLLDEPGPARRWLAGLGVRDVDRGSRDLADLLRRAGDAKLRARLAGQLQGLLPRCPDPDMALTNLDRYVAASPAPERVLERLAGHPRTTE